MMEIFIPALLGTIVAPFALSGMLKFLIWIDEKDYQRRNKKA